MKRTVEKRTMLCRSYGLIYQGTRHLLDATSAVHLADQVMDITGNKQHAQMARTIWGDNGADLNFGGMRLVAIGEVTRTQWRALPLQKSGAPTTEFSPHSPTNAPVSKPEGPEFSRTETPLLF